MARERIDYSRELADIGAPVESRAGDLAAKSLATAGKASAMKQDANTGLLTFLGTHAIAADKGYREAELEKEILPILDRLEREPAAGDVRGVTFGQDMAARRTIFQEPMTAEATTPALVANFRETLGRFTEAERQGMLSRGEVVTRVGEAIKRFSAQMPGYAQDFRKIGAELTGISNIDVLGIHQALTTQSRREKNAEAMDAARIQAIKEIASAQGVLPEQVNSTMLAAHFQSKQLALAAQNMDNKLKMMTAEKTVADEAYGQRVDIMVSSAVVDFGKEFAKLGALNADPSKAIEAKEFGLQLSTRVAVIGQQLEQEIRKLTTPTAGRTAMSVEAAEKRIAAARATIKELQEGMKTVEGRNMMAGVVQNSKDRLELLLNNFKLANPYIASLNAVGVMPSGLAQAWVTLPPEQFRKQFPKSIADAFANLTANPQPHANLMANTAQGGTVNLPELSRIDPDLVKVFAADVENNLFRWIQDPNPTPEKLSAWAGQFGAMYADGQNFSMSVPRNIESVHKLLNHEWTERFAAKLSPAQRTKAFGDIVARTENAISNMVATVQGELDKWNTPVNIAARQGVLFKLEKDNLTGQLRVVEDITQERGQASKFDSDDPAQPARYGPGMLGGLGVGAQSRLNSREAIKRAKELVGSINKLVEVYVPAVKLLNPEAKIDFTSIRQKVWEGAERGKMGPLSERQPAADVPKNVTAIENEAIIRGIVAAERSGDTAVGAAGEVGRFQIKEDTAKELGLKVDKDAGVDERTDPAKAGPAAAAYVRKHLASFDGDIRKAIAAYNAGAGSVRAAVAKAAKEGVPGAWEHYLPKPQITGPYIARFIQGVQQ